MDRTSEYNYKKYKRKRIPLDVSLEEYNKLKTHTDKHGLTVNGFIRQLIKKALMEG